jgi:hypothetical protein
MGQQGKIDREFSALAFGQFVSIVINDKFRGLALPKTAFIGR